MNTLGERIFKIRTARGLSLGQVAEKVKCAKATIGHYETGYTKSISMDLIFRIADALGVSARWLATGNGSPEAIAFPTDDEQELLATYRTLPKELQAHIRKTASDLAAAVLPSPPYPSAPSAKNGGGGARNAPKIRDKA